MSFLRSKRHILNLNDAKCYLIMAIAFCIIDAFASEPFQGNPAAVCLLDSDSMAEMSGEQTTKWMQNVAAEMNLSETAFLNLKTNRLRWFTAQAEVDLCGHATLATAKALIDFGWLSPGESLAFQTRSGELLVKALESNRSSHRGVLIQLDFPSTPPSEIAESDANRIKPLFTNMELGLALSDPMIFVGKSRFDVLVELPTQKNVEDLVLDFEELKSLPFRGLIVTAKSSSAEFDFVSRFFAPAVGVNEDPVTGSAHCCLAPYWAEKLSKNKMKAKQLSQRGGEIAIELYGDRVRLTGQAFTVVSGTLTV